EAQIPPPTIPSIILENLPTFNSAFRFEERLRLLETSFNEYRQTNQVAGAVSAILGIVHQFIDQQLKEAVREVVQQKTDQLQDSLQRENDEFLCNIDENIKNVLKGLVKTHVKEQQTYKKWNSRRSLSKKWKEIDDDQEGPSAGPNRGSKRQREGGEQTSASTPFEKATKGAGGSTKGTQSRQQSANKSAQAEEPVQTTCQMEETPLPLYETGADDQPIVQTSQHPEWFSQPRKPPSP
nr:hypothetical protein [Tanacetum cinerariifolium]